MRGPLSVVVMWLASSSFACSVSEGEPGDECLRSTECAAGLVCIEGVCSDDLSSIADPGEVPVLMTDEAGMVLEPEPDAGTPPADAAMMLPPVDAATTTPAADAALPSDGG